MSDFHVEVTRVIKVEHHPNADRLSLLQIKGYECISAKLVDGTHRYNEGDLVVYIPEAAIVPKWLLKVGEFWNYDTNTGMLAGKDCNRVKALKLRGIFSQGILYPLKSYDIDNNEKLWVIENETKEKIKVREGEDVADLLGITKWDPPIPIALAGEVCNIAGKTLRYDFENWQSVPNIFESTDIVVASEKIHGTCFQFGFIPNFNHPELFDAGNIFAGSKGLSAQGLVFKDNIANDGNTYVRILRKILKNGFGDVIHNVSESYGNVSVHIFGEIFGPGIQDLKYGLTEPELRIFDIAIDKNFLGFDEFLEVASILNLTTVPILFKGLFNEQLLKTHRDGKTTFGEANVREGIVIKTIIESRHIVHGRKIAKMVSPDYLLRRNKDATEYQ
jgi:RNA ligase (TIGR02306 family)